MTSRFCAKCGAESRDAGFKFCARCGAPLETGEAGGPEAGATVLKPLTGMPPAIPPSAPVTPPQAMPPAYAYAPPVGYARQRASQAPRIIAAVLLFVYVVVEVWGFADDNVWMPFARRDWDELTYLPGELKASMIAGVVVLVVLILAVVVPPVLRIVAGAAALLAGVVYLVPPLIFLGRRHILTEWFHEDTTSAVTLTVLGVVVILGAVAYVIVSAFTLTTKGRAFS